MCHVYVGYTYYFSSVQHKPQTVNIEKQALAEHVPVYGLGKQFQYKSVPLLFYICEHCTFSSKRWHHSFLSTKGWLAMRPAVQEYVILTNGTTCILLRSWSHPGDHITTNLTSVTASTKHSHWQVCDLWSVNIVLFMKNLIKTLISWSLGQPWSYSFPVHSSKNDQSW